MMELDDLLYRCIVSGLCEEVREVLSVAQTLGHVHRLRLYRRIVDMLWGGRYLHIATHDPSHEALHLGHILLHIEEDLIEDLPLVGERGRLLAKHSLLA